MARLRLKAHFKIHDGELAEFKAAAAECLRIVREKDRGTHLYDWLLNESQTECVVLETYDDSAAVLAHVANLGDALGALLAVSDISLEIYGDASPELRAAVAAFPVTSYTWLQGLEGE